jgi:uncharacterized repeat protein (TIGR03837 family)
MTQPSRIEADLFCRVIDNYGDIGVMWRLARILATEKQWHVRLWVDNLRAFERINPAIDTSRVKQYCDDVDIRLWQDPWQMIDPYPIVIAGFSCDLPQPYVVALRGKKPIHWIELEYLSAESWTESFHGLSSQRSDGLAPKFCFPGFTSSTAGLLREHSLLAQIEQWQADEQKQASWLSLFGIKRKPGQSLISVFTYPGAPLERFAITLDTLGMPFHLLLSESTGPVCMPSSLTNVTWQRLAFLPQTEYDKLLWSCDLNLVRGEDSLVRAIWAGKPLVWQIYPQSDGTHHKKLEAWLNRAELPGPIRRWMHQWADALAPDDLSDCLNGEAWQIWQKQASRFRAHLAAQDDLASVLNRWCRL